MKNAEASIVEKYSSEVKAAVESLLSEEFEEEEEESDESPVMDEVPYAAEDGNDEPITVRLDLEALERALDEEGSDEAEETHEDLASEILDENFEASEEEDEEAVDGDVEELAEVNGDTVVKRQNDRWAKKADKGELPPFNLQSADPEEKDISASDIRTYKKDNKHRDNYDESIDIDENLLAAIAEEHRRFIIREADCGHVEETIRVEVRDREGKIVSHADARNRVRRDVEELTRAIAK
jgi:hypothetical protein